tara:strand:+ start:20267 stop:20488 length:222 start_codon:yes stop_codon:yes gene_type:complete
LEATLWPQSDDLVGGGGWASATAGGERRDVDKAFFGGGVADVLPCRFPQRLGPVWRHLCGLWWRDHTPWHLGK